MESVGCFLHPDAPSAHALEANGYTARRCGVCGLIFVTPRPTPDPPGHDDRDGTARARPEAPLRAAHRANAWRRARRTLRQIRRHVRGGILLELGAGGGVFAATAGRRGFEPLAVEPDPVRADAIRDELGVPCLESLREVEELPDRLFDVVYHCDVLSHLRDPLAVFARLHALLRDGGLMVFETGNLADVDPRFYPDIPGFQFPDHLHLFGDRSLDELLRRSGFARIATRRWALGPALRTERRLRALTAVAPRPTDPEAFGVGGPLGPGTGPAGRTRDVASAAGWAVLQSLVYDVGRLVPKRGRPQTQLIVARKA